jgi:hypothetical protein
MPARSWLLTGLLGGCLPTKYKNVFVNYMVQIVYRRGLITLVCILSTVLVRSST